MIKSIKQSKLIGSLHEALYGEATHLKHYQKYIGERDNLEKKLLNYIQDKEYFTSNVCPCCQKHETKFSFKNPNGFTYDVCKNDGTIFLNPVPTEKTLSIFYESPIHAYHWLRGEDPDKIKVNPSNTEDLETILRWAPDKKNKYLLDVGSANGSFLLNAKQYFQISGIELNPLTSRIANNNGIPTFNGRVEDYTKTEKFDIISMLQVLEHITNPKEILNDVHQLIKPDGYLYINTPNIDSASFKYLKEYHEHVSSFEHVSLFNKESLVKTVEDCGFEVIHAEYWFGKDLNLHDIISLVINKKKFHHRVALYNQRLYYFSNFLQTLLSGFPVNLIKGNDSYVRAIFKKRRV